MRGCLGHSNGFSTFYNTTDRATPHTEIDLTRDDRAAADGPGQKQFTAARRIASYSIGNQGSALDAAHRGRNTGRACRRWVVLGAFARWSKFER